LKTGTEIISATLFWVFRLCLQENPIAKKYRMNKKFLMSSDFNNFSSTKINEKCLRKKALNTMR
jgi:hypothetical protein